MINWVHKQATKVRFTLIIDKSYLDGGRRAPMLLLAYERGGVYKGTKNNLNQEDTE